VRKAVLATAVLAVLAAVWWGRHPTPAPPSLQGIVLITIDTLRADRLDAARMPQLSRFAQRGRRFTHARTTAPLTLPAHASVMTGLLPPAHGARENGDRVASLPTLATLLRSAGFRTGAFVSAFVLDRQFGLAEGFDVYDDEVPRDPDAALRFEAERRGETTVDRALAWVNPSSPSNPSNPFFLWVHLFEPHAPYPSGYDRDVAEADTQIGRLIARVSATYDRARIAWIVAGDHGESLGSHGEATHGMLLYDGALRVPLLVQGPGVEPATIDAPASLADIAPTILQWTGVAAPGNMRGVDLRRDIPRDRDVYSETLYPSAAGWHGLSGLSGSTWKVIRSSEIELYDIAADPEERMNRTGEHRAMSRAMADAAGAIADSDAPRSQAAAPEVRERLRALGYVSGSAARPAGAAAPNPAREIRHWVTFERALSLMASGRSRDALADLAGLVSRYPAGRTFKSTYARALQDAGRHAEAMRLYRDLVGAWPGDAMVFHDLASAARAAGHAEEALRAEQAALALDPRNAAALNGLGLVHADAGRAAEAARAFEQAAARDPGNASYAANLGNARRALGDLAGAEAAYQRAIARAPDHADALNGLGVLRVQSRRPAEAIPLFQRALAADPHHLEARLNLGIALQESGRRDEAVVVYRDVLTRAKRGTREWDAARALLGGR